MMKIAGGIILGWLGIAIICFLAIVLAALDWRRIGAAIPGLLCFAGFLAFVALMIASKP